MSLCVVFRESPKHFGNDLLYLARPDRAKQFGGHKAVVRPVPIPNTAVKHSLANGSGCIASARVGCRQSFKKLWKFSTAFYLLLRRFPDVYREVIYKCDGEQFYTLERLSILDKLVVIPKLFLKKYEFPKGEA